MTIKNADIPAMPQDDAIWCQRIGECPTLAIGLTKRETFCLHMGVAETGDAELDAIIHRGNRQKMAMHIMTGLCSKYRVAFDTDTVQDAIRMADFLLAELERTK